MESGEAKPNETWNGKIQAPPLQQKNVVVCLRVCWAGLCFAMAVLVVLPLLQLQCGGDGAMFGQ